MNKYLQKIANSVSKKELPLRSRTEVIIIKDGHILVTKNKNKENGDTWAGLPGGGLDGDSAEQACINECLEEVGITINNIKYTGVEHTQIGGMSKKEDRHLKFRGSLTKWYTADFVEVDRSKLGADGDSRQYSWQTHQEALQAFKRGKVMAVPRVKALTSLRGLKSV